jgi:hypothetical protein
METPTFYHNNYPSQTSKSTSVSVYSSYIGHEIQLVDFVIQMGSIGQNEGHKNLEPLQEIINSPEFSCNKSDLEPLQHKI